MNITELKAEAWDMARQIDAINEQMRPFAEQIRALQQQIANKMAEIAELEKPQAQAAE